MGLFRAARDRRSLSRRRIAPRTTSAGAALLLVASSFVVAPVVTAAAGDIGFEGPSYTGSSSAPSGSKPESKLWYNDGIWWADLWSTTANVFHIWRLDLAGHQWIDTGVAVDRKGTRADALWDGTKLYILSHVYSTSPATGNPMRLYRYSYNSTTKAYSLDSGFPATVSDYKTETAVFDKDSTGRLWATWVQNNQVVVTHTNGTDNVWVTPFVLPATGTTVDPDDISSIIAFKKAGGTPRIGVMWSNQVDSKMHFAFHNDGAADSAWDDSAIALQGTKNADDHINLKSLDSDNSGRIFAVTKTSQTTGSAPLIMLLTFTPSGTAGTWSATTVSRVSDGPTRPIVIIDQQAMQAHVYMTGPVAPATTGDNGGKIVEKVSSLSTLGFPVGAGTTVMQDASSPAINNVSSTKQNVNATTGLVLIAGNDSTSQYWWAYDALGGTPPPPAPPVAAFTEAPPSGPAPLTVQFTDTSSNTPASWDWDFGDATAHSMAANPSHTYTSPGTYTVTLVAKNGDGQDDATNTVTVGQPLATQTFTPTADSFTSQASPTKNYGTDAALRVRNSSSSFRSFLKFNVTGLSGTVQSVKLRLWVNDASANGGSVYPVSSAWTETGTGSITWNTAPALPGSALNAVGPVTAIGTWAEVDLGAAAVAGNGTVSFAIAGGSSDSAYYSSRTGTNAPQLVVSTDSGGPPPPKPVADFTASPLNPTTGQSVQFTDQSTNTPTSWDWDFGDGTTHGSTANPTHAYANPGQYTVKLVATNGGGASDPATKSAYITVSAAPPPAPVAAFHADRTTGTAPLAVQFTDDSTNSPTSWAWDFDNDGTTDSTAQNPSFIYTAPGPYSVKLTASNLGGPGSTTKSSYITVSSGSTTTSTFLSTQDTRPNQANPTSLTGGTDPVLRVRLDPTGAYHTLVRFNVTGLAGTITSAKLRLFCTDASPNGGTAYKTSGAWSEATTNWNNAPAATSGAAGTALNVVAGAWAEFDVTALVTGNGQVDLLVQDGSSNSAYYSSREGANPPQLVITTGP